MLSTLDFQRERPMSVATNEATPRRITVRGRYGDIAVPSHDDPVGRAMRLYGEWAQIEVDFLCGLIGRGSTVLDVGAGVGMHSIAFARRVGPSGAVRAFEPRVAVHDLLRCNLAGTGSSNVTAELLAVADRAGAWAAPAVANGRRAGSLALRPGGPSEAGDGTTVRAIAIDDLDLDRCDLVRIGVGGMEPLVIKGLGDTIRRLQPLVFCECGTIEAGIDLLRLLPRSYRAFLVRCPAFNAANLLGATDNIFGHACGSSLLLVPSSAAQLVATGWNRDAEVVAVDGVEDLGRAILATPRQGDASPFERDPERLGRELSSIGAALSEQNARLLGATQSHMQAVQRVDELRESLRSVEQAKQSLQDRADALRDDLERKDDEIARLAFRAESLTACLRRLEDRLDRAEAARDQALQDAARLGRELDAARNGMEGDIRTIAGHCSRVADVLAQGSGQTAQLAAGCSEIATRDTRADAAIGATAEEVVQLLRQALDRRPGIGFQGLRRPGIGRLASMFRPIRKDYQKIVGSGLFDESWYLASNRDVAERGVDALTHYLRRGASENRDPSPHFSTGRYLASNPDVARAGVNPLVHYVRHGRREGRPVAPGAASRDVAPSKDAAS